MFGVSRLRLLLLLLLLLFGWWFGLGRLVGHSYGLREWVGTSGAVIVEHGGPTIRSPKVAVVAVVVAVVVVAFVVLLKFLFSDAGVLLFVARRRRLDEVPLAIGVIHVPVVRLWSWYCHVVVPDVHMRG